MRRWTESYMSCFGCWQAVRLHDEDVARIRRSLLDLRAAVEREG